AFESPLLLDAIATVPGGIEALVLEWSDPDKIAITVGWTRIGSRATAAAFAASLRATKRSSNGLTAIGSALLAAAAAFDHFPGAAGYRRAGAAQRNPPIAGTILGGLPPALAGVHPPYDFQKETAPKCNRCAAAESR